MFSVSRFAELLKSLPRSLFDRTVAQRQADKHRKGFSCWRQLVAMVYAQLSSAPSLRVLVKGFNAHPAHHYHLGCRTMHRSTLAEANERGDCEVFAVVAQALMQQVQSGLRSEAGEFLRLLDATSLSLKGRGFDEWTLAHRTRRTQGLKLHVLFGPAEQAPLAQRISAAHVNDIDCAREFELEAGVIYVFDKAYCDYSWWWRIAQSGARFVTRFKRNARFEVLNERRVAQHAQPYILKDQLVRLSNAHPGKGRKKHPYNTALRRIEVARDGQDPLVLATNDLKSAALKIAERYRARWQIELFFKWIKQHLNIKCFLGRSENAVRIQILTALIAYLLAVLHAKAQGVKSSLWLHLSELRATLFQRPYSELQRHRRWREHKAFFDLNQRPLFV